MPTTENKNTVSAPSVSTLTAKPDFGNGRYSAAMAEFCKDLQRVLHVAPDVAVSVAHEFGSDFGRAMASAPVDVRIAGKMSKGLLNLRETSKVKVLATNSITLARLVVALDDARTFGLTHIDSKYMLSDALVKFLVSHGAKANA
jgi:hypothetical protein